MGGCLRSKHGLYALLFLCLSGAVCMAIRYSVPEEKRSGSLVANVLEDLEVGVGELTARGARLVSKGPGTYFHLDLQSGNLLTNDKLDRETLCEQTESCILEFQIVLQNPLKIYSMEIQIEDVNDNAPKFPEAAFELDIPENIPTKTRFPLESAKDEDLGQNGIQNYTLSPNEHFWLDVQSNEDGSKYVDMVLEQVLDREKEARLALTLLALDGGLPQRTGTALLTIRVLDNNDNFPEFTQSEYKAKLQENSPRGTQVCTVEARDSDFGSNALITYAFHRLPNKIFHLFHLDERTGAITVLGELDYEKERSYEMKVRATDGGGLSGHCKVLVEIEDLNDNVPEVSVISITSPLPEDSPLETLVALFRVTDQDSGDNGWTSCSVQVDLPFVLKATVNNYYQLVVQGPLDREKAPEYNITVTATDRGSPRLTSTRAIHIGIADINDNPPAFEKPSHEMHVRENNIPGLLLGVVRAVDQDSAQNGRVTYSLLPGMVGGGPVAAYVSVNSETGNVYALRSLDYEQVQGFQVAIRATDGGSPALSSEAVVRVTILDENDNTPFFLHPLQNSSHPCNELVPSRAEAGYLVTKAVAVDGDSGQNAWLSYELLKATDPGLFSIGPQTGEVRTRRALTERDAGRQRLVLLVRDNGVPPQSSTAMLHVLPVGGFSDPYLKSQEASPEERGGGDTLTTYLVVCLAVVSAIFLVCVVSLVMVRVCRKGSGESPLTAPPQFPPARPEFPENGSDSQSGSLPRTYHYDVCLTGGSLSSEFRFLRPLIPVFSMGEPNLPGKHVATPGAQGISEQVAGRESWEQARAALSEDSAPRPAGPGGNASQAAGANVSSGQTDWLSYQ